MNNITPNPRTLLECDLVILAKFYECIKNEGFESFEEYFQSKIDESTKNELVTLSKKDIKQTIDFINEYLMDDDSSWADNFNPFKSTNTFTFAYLYKSAQDWCEDFPLSNWDLISRHSKILLGKAFKQFVLKTEENAKDDEWYIKMDGMNMSNAAIYKLIKK